MPYPQNVYSVTAEDDNTITVRTTNKKYFKKIIVPDLERAGLKVVQDRISFTHQYSTLIITVREVSVFLIHLHNWTADFYAILYFCEYKSKDRI